MSESFDILRGTVPNIDPDLPVPCRNEDVSGTRENDIFFGKGFGHENVEQALDHAVSLCETVCKVQFPEAYDSCRQYAIAERPAYGVFGGIRPRRR